MTFSDALLLLTLFFAKSFILVLFVLIVLVVFFMLLAKSKQRPKAKLTIKNLNKHYEENKEMIYDEVLPKKHFKKFLKEQKKEEKSQHKTDDIPKNVYVLNFHGDIKASAVCNLREEVTAILTVTTPKDEVVVRLDSGGGLVNAYGLAAAQLMRLREHHIPLTITIDKIAASGGYMMACIANKILAAPFAIIGSIGVIVQLPNFHRVLKNKDIEFEQLTAGEYKRTLTVFGENTEAGREKLQEEIEDVHQVFKNLITEHRKAIDIQKVATGEHWLGLQAVDLKLVDEIKTSDEYLLESTKVAKVYEICYEIKKPFFSKLSGSAAQLQEKLFGLFLK